MHEGSPRSLIHEGLQDPSCPGSLNSGCMGLSKILDAQGSTLGLSGWPGDGSIPLQALQLHQPPLVSLQAVEGDHSSFPVRPIRNEQPLLILLAWLPALESRDLQVFLSARLRRLCEASLPSRLTCVKAGMVGSLLGALATEPALPGACSQNLLELLRSLGSLSIRPGELRQLLRLLRRQRGRGPHPYVAPVIRALSGMARGEGPPRALQSFDLSPGMAGIMVPTIQKWPGGAFAFHAWLCLSEEEPEPPARPKRRQLYR